VVFLLPGDAYGHWDAKIYSPVALKVRNRVQIVVLGDIARSPRMRYHALSIANHGVAVDIVGYVGVYSVPYTRPMLTNSDTELPAEITSHKLIWVHALRRPPKVLEGKSSKAFIITGPLKALFQFFTLWRTMGNTTRPAKWLLIQVIPT